MPCDVRPRASSADSARRIQLPPTAAVSRLLTPFSVQVLTLSKTFWETSTMENESW